MTTTSRTYKLIIDDVETKYSSLDQVIEVIRRKMRYRDRLQSDFKVELIAVTEAI